LPSSAYSRLFDLERSLGLQFDATLLLV